MAAATTALTQRLLRGSSFEQVPAAVRVNFRGREVSLRGGAAAAAGAIAATVVSGSPARAGAALVATAAAAAGAYDDLVAPGIEHTADKGWRGHLDAVRAGRISGGAVKVAAIVGAATLVCLRRDERLRDRLSATVVVAGTANLVNLLDLRPGRAVKAVTLLTGAALGGASGGLAGAALGAAWAQAPGDLAESTMLGDVGANTLGAVAGMRLAQLPPPIRLALAVTVAGLSVISEQVSFNAVIDSVPVLRRIDSAGRMGLIGGPAGRTSPA